MNSNSGPAAARPRGRFRGIWIAAAVAALAVAAWTARGHWQAAHPAVTYLTRPVSVGAVVPSVITSGTVNPVTTVQVGSYVSGVIEAIHCDFNTRVRAGQLCASIDARPYQVVVDQDQAGVDAARAQLAKDTSAAAYAGAVLRRDLGLQGPGVVSQETLETARDADAQARAQVDLDRATLAQRLAALRAAQVNLGYTRIVSPVDGTVVSRNVTQGQTVAASFQTPTLFLIAADLTQMQVDVNVSESDIGHVAPGDAADFTVAAFADRHFRGRVVQVRQAPQTVQNVVTYDVVVAVRNEGLSLKPGMTASVRLETARADRALRVPDEALRYAPRGTAPAAGRATRVWVLDHGQPRAVDVAIGLDDDSFAQVLRGALREGDPVIVGERSGTGARDAGTGAGAGNGGGAGGASPRLPHM